MAGTIPRVALKAAWLKTKEQTRTAARENDTDPRQQKPTDLAGSAAEQAAAFVWHQGRKLAENQARQHRQEETAARAHAAGERGVSPKQAGHGTLPDAEQHPRRGADLPRQRAKEKAVIAKTAPRDIRGVTQSQRWTRTAANETVRSVMPQAQMQTHTQKIRLAAQKAAAGTGRTAVTVRSAIRHFLASLHSLITILAAGAGAALGIVIVISLVAFVSGSAYGIFFAANALGSDTITVQQAVETLTEEYRDRLEEISDTVQHDRQDITANDDVCATITILVLAPCNNKEIHYTEKEKKCLQKAVHRRIAEYALIVMVLFTIEPMFSYILIMAESSVALLVVLAKRGFGIQ